MLRWENFCGKQIIREAHKKIVFLVQAQRGQLRAGGRQLHAAAEEFPREASEQRRGRGRGRGLGGLQQGEHACGLPQHHRSVDSCQHNWNLREI